jgi:SAM-dependent methyltransferase
MEVNYLRRYLKEAPISQALWRSLECKSYARFRFKQPLLDIGTGDGTFASIFFTRQVAAGIDRDQKQLNLAARKRKYHSLKLAEANALPFKDNSFNTVLSNCVIEHVADQQATFDEIRRVMRPGARFYFTVPSIYREEYSPFPWLRTIGLNKVCDSLNRLLRRVWLEEHFYPPADWSKILKRSRLRLVSHSYYCSRSAYTIYGLFLPSAFFSWLSKRLINHWLPLRWLRHLTTPIWERLLWPFYSETEPKQGAGLLLVAEKVAK